MKQYERLLLENKAWAAEQLDRDPEYFSRLSKLQTPEFLWIGCSDSRVSANEITNTAPGEIFVHRNIANLVVESDLNMLSVLQYAVEVLLVKHVIVCGHYGCGGIKASMSSNNLGLIDQWLENIRRTHRKHQNELNMIANRDACAARLTELNVKAQVVNLANTSIIQQAWRSGHRPTLHGWVYSLEDGILHTLIKLDTRLQTELNGPGGVG
jgi:carbonic anhydrase